MLRSALAILAVATAGAAEWQAWTTTATGSGADATIQAEQPNMGGESTIAVRFNQFPAHIMKTFLRFDLRKLERAPGLKTIKAGPLNLVLTLAGKPDADHTINVFGLIERRSYGGTKVKPILAADWAEKELTYANAPAGSPYGGGVYAEGKEKWEKGMLGGVNHEPTALLGTIKVSKDQEGEVVTPLPALTAFMEKNAKSKIVTLILCRVSATEGVTAFVAKEGDPTKAPKLAF